MRSHSADSETRILFVSSEAQLSKVLRCSRDARRAPHVDGRTNGVLPAKVARCRHHDAGPEQRDPEFDVRATNHSHPVATLIYTSGTTERLRASCCRIAIWFQISPFSRSLRDGGKESCLVSAAIAHHAAIAHSFDVPRREYRILFPI